MKLIIKELDNKNNVFYSYNEDRKTGFYLTNKQASIFFNYLKVGVLVDFEISGKTKVFKHKKAYQIAHFNKITDIRNKRVIYNHLELKNDMLEFLKKQEYYLFLDLEMTISHYRQKNFKAEIIQYGYLLTKDNEVILEDGEYLKVLEGEKINKKTFKFLSIKEDVYEDIKVPFMNFYDKLKYIVSKYHPKIIVWGKNDIIAINNFYAIHKVKAITNDKMFVDLLKLHKDYFNLKNDVGLFKAYETYYLKNYEQMHDAKDDATVTKDVFQAFLSYISKENKKEK